MGDTNEENEDSSDDSRDKPSGNDTPGDGDGIPARAEQDSPPEITIDVESEILYHNQELEQDMGPSQTLTMLGSLTIQVFLN